MIVSTWMKLDFNETVLGESGFAEHIMFYHPAPPPPPPSVEKS